MTPLQAIPPYWLATSLCLTATTAYLARRLRVAVDTRPQGHVPGASAACDPDAARAQSRQDRSGPWRLVHRYIADFALSPFLRRPVLLPTRILVIDHGPGALVQSIASRAPRDATIAAIDANAGMGTLARVQCARLDRHAKSMRIGWIHATGAAIPAPTETFDLVVTVGALHSWSDPQTVMREIQRVIAPNGRIVIVDTRRDLATWAWVVLKVAQRLLMPRSLRAVDEPSTSFRAGFRAPELEWFAARAKFPEFRIHEAPAWLILEAGRAEGDAVHQRRTHQP